MQQYEERIIVAEQQSIYECIICGQQTCTKCKSMNKNELRKNTMFISASGIAMLGLTFAASISTFSLIGLGLNCGAILSLLFYQ
jgi:hypothetical protein